MGASPCYFPTSVTVVRCGNCDSELKPQGDDYEHCPKCFPPFTDLDFLNEYPAGRVAENEVFMSFNEDSEAIAFREWWNEEGAVGFFAWLREREKENE